MHIGVDSETKLVHSIASTSANNHDSQMLQDLLHGEETRVWGDSAYTGLRDAILEKSPYAQDFTHRRGFGKRQLTEDSDLARHATRDCRKTPRTW